MAEFVRDGLHRELQDKLNADSKLTQAASCEKGTYRLIGKVKEINSEIDSHFRLVTVTVNNKFEVDVEGELLRCNTGERIMEVSASEKDEKMDEVLEEIADDIVKKIRKEPAPIQPANRI